ncbi:MAG: hypothetical protein Q9211_001475 [Gyalolechia sp. 1 TL-2023]
MANNPVTSQDINIVYAAQVSLPQLCARVLAFVETKASITTLRFSVRHAPFSAALHSLPEEMISMVAGYLRDLAFEDQIERWLRLSRCLAGECKTSSHLRPDERAAPGYDSPNSNYDEALVEDAWQRHAEAVNCCYKDLTDLDGNSGFAKRIQCFAKYSTLRPYFVMSKSYNTLYSSPAEFAIDAKAYLVLPVTKIPILFTPSYEAVNFIVNTTIDLSLTRELSENQRQEFHAAAAMLKVHPYDAHEEKELGMQLWLYDLKVDQRRIEAYEAESDVGVPNDGELDEGGEDNWEQGDVGRSGGEEDTNAGYKGQREELPTLDWPRLSLPREDEPQTQFQPKLMVLGCGEPNALPSGWNGY